MQYIIMAGGKYKQFETPKQLFKVNGERLIERTIRLLKENGVEDIAITSHDTRFDNLGVPRIEHNNPFEAKNGITEKGYWVDAFMPSNAPICYLFGDVYYSDYAITTIVETNTDDVLFFASKNVNRPEYFKPWQEPFAFKVVNQEKFRNSIEICKQKRDSGEAHREPIAWEVYRILNGYDINTHIMDKNYIAIDDYTTDIDCVDDIAKLEAVL